MYVWHFLWCTNPQIISVEVMSLSLRERERERETKNRIYNSFLFPSVPPAFTRTPPESSEGVRGERFRLTCEASGRPSPTISWSRMSQRVSELGDPLILDPGNGSLIFEQLQRNHSGLYLCEIQGPRSMTSQTLLSVVDMDEEFMGVGKLIEEDDGLTHCKVTIFFTHEIYLCRLRVCESSAGRINLYCINFSSHHTLQCIKR